MSSGSRSIYVPLDEVDAKKNLRLFWNDVRVPLRLTVCRSSKASKQRQQWIFAPLPLFVGDFQRYYELRQEKPKLYFSVQNSALFSSALPLVALIFCVSSSLYYDFESVTRTHCHVYNFLPSISAAIGNSSSGRFIWRIFIFAHILPRYIVCISYGYYFLLLNGTCVQIEAVHYSYSNHLVFNFFELNSLLLLTIFTSNEHHGVHVFAFAAFQVCALMYMILHLALFKHSGCYLSGRLERHSYRFKKKCLVATVILLSLCTYLYYHHNTFCRPFVFSAFSLCEYLLVVANVFFHSTIRFDLHSQYVILG